MVGILAQVDDIFSWAPRGGKLTVTGWECANKAMGTLTSYVGALFVGRRGNKGSTGFCWINNISSTCCCDLLLSMMCFRRTKQRRQTRQPAPPGLSASCALRGSSVSSAIFLARHSAME